MLSWYRSFIHQASYVKYGIKFLFFVQFQTRLREPTNHIILSKGILSKNPSSKFLYHPVSPSLRIQPSPRRWLSSPKPPQTRMAFSAKSPIGAVASQPLGAGR